MPLAVADAYRLWAPTYDATPNPVTALETRLLEPHLQHLQGLRVLDAACGTGRWLTRIKHTAAFAVGVDLSHPMLSHARVQNLLVANVCSIPLATDSCDLALCSFALSYVADLAAALAELARVARRLIITDLHPSVATQWTRGFRAQGTSYEITHHPYSEQHLHAAARANGLHLQTRIEAGFGDPERPLFVAAGKEEQWHRLQHSPAILITAWTRA